MFISCILSSKKIKYKHIIKKINILYPNIMSILYAKSRHNRFELLTVIKMWQNLCVLEIEIAVDFKAL